MDLLSAFRELQPLTPGLHPDTRGRVREAARLLFAELSRLSAREARTYGMPEADADTVVQTVLYRLLQAGPRGVREQDPQTADAVSGWLTQAVRNALRDLLRRRKRLVQPSSHDDDRDWFAQQPSDDSVDDGVMVERLEHERARAAVQRARTRLWSVLVPRAVSRKERRSTGAGARLHTTLEELRAACAEGIDVGEVARRSLIAEGQEPERRVVSKRRVALDKRFQRAREAVLAVIDEDKDQGDVDALVGRAMVFVVQEELYLQRRKDSLAARRRIPAGPRTASGGFPIG